MMRAPNFRLAGATCGQCQKKSGTNPAVCLHTLLNVTASQGACGYILFFHEHNTVPQSARLPL